MITTKMASPTRSRAEVLKEHTLSPFTGFYIVNKDKTVLNTSQHDVYCSTNIKIAKIDSEDRLRTTLYDKRDYLNFPIVHFPFICSNIPTASAYEVYISQLIRYMITCGSYHDFLYRGLLLTRMPLNQGFLLVKLKSSLRKFYGRHNDLINRHGISV